MNRKIRALALLLALLFVLPLCASCTKLEENQIKVKWHHGLVASDTHDTAPLSVVEKADGYSYSDVITVPNKGTRITFTDFNGEGAVDTEYAGSEVFVVSHWIEKNGEWVIDHPGDNYTGTGGRSGEIAKWEKTETRYSYVTSYDNESIRLCYRSGQTSKNKRKIEFAKVYTEITAKEGTLLSSKTDILKDLMVADFLETAKQDMWFEELKGVTMYAMGDSYFQGSKNGKAYVWPNLMAQKYDMAFSNWGIGGSTLSTGGSNPMCNRIGNMSAGDPQIVLLEGGRNDFNASVPIGDLNSTDTATVCGAINSCIEQLRQKYPNALIIGVTCWNYDTQPNKSGHRQADYGNAMINVCEKQGIPCFNAMDETVTGVRMNDKSFRAEYSQDENDVSHLNTKGMILVEPAFEKFIGEQYKAFIAK